MTAAASERSQRRPVDGAALQHQLRRLNNAPQSPWLHGEVARRMAERLPAIRLQPRRVLDWGAFLGGGALALRAQYPSAELWAVEDDTLRPPDPAQPWWRAMRRGTRAPRRVRADALEAGGAQLLWSNMGLHFEADPQALFSRWQQAVAVGGFLMFSTLGPGTLTQLAALYREAGWPAPLAPLVDMHDIGDMLVHAGFADPVMDQETVTLTWPDAAACLAELRSLGGNAALDRHAGLRTPRWRGRLEAALAERAERAGVGGRIALGFEVVYGHAFRAATRVRVAEETRVPLADMRAMVRGGGTPR